MNRSHLHIIGPIYNTTIRRKQMLQVLLANTMATCQGTHKDGHPDEHRRKGDTEVLTTVGARTSKDGTCLH